MKRMMGRGSKWLAILLTLCMMASVSGCGSGQAPAASEPAETEQPVVETEVETKDEKEKGAAGIGALIFPESVPDIEEESEEATEEATEEETEAPAAQEDHSDEMDVTGVDFDALSELSNSSEDYGFNNSDRDSLNRPDGIYWYDRMYKQYSGLTHVDTEEKLIYLTMDEGYENGYTPKILDTLKAKGVKVVFFITKQFYDENPDLIQRMIDEGHTIGNHTCAHPAGGMPQLGARAEYEDIKKLNDLVYDKFDYQMKLFRFPEGVASPQAVALLEQMGYTSVFWSFAYHDYDADDQMDPDEALSRCISYLHPGAIYLLHAVSSTNASILGDFIDEARDRGYEFAKVQPVN